MYPTLLRKCITTKSLPCNTYHRRYKLLIRGVLGGGIEEQLLRPQLSMYNENSLSSPELYTRFETALT